MNLNSYFSALFQKWQIFGAPYLHSWSLHSTNTQRHILILINRVENFRILFFKQKEHFPMVPHKTIEKSRIRAILVCTQEIRVKRIVNNSAGFRGFNAGYYNVRLFESSALFQVQGGFFRGTFLNLYLTTWISIWVLLMAFTPCMSWVVHL